MFNFRRKPLIAIVALVATVVTGFLPSSLLADCRCGTPTKTAPSCCSAKAAKCCCSVAVKKVTVSHCPVAPASSKPASCCPERLTTNHCQCNDCGCSAAPASEPRNLPRSAELPRLELSYVALPSAVVSEVPSLVSTTSSLLNSPGYLAPPVRERFCVWII